MRPPVPSDEAARLEALAAYQITAPDAKVDLGDIVDLAMHLFDIPIVLISVMTRDRQIVKAGAGLDVCEGERRLSFCTHVLDLDEVMVVPDATRDPRFATNPFVVGEPRIRFYAGIALRAPCGQPIGTLCLVDRVPRRGLDEREQANLRALAALILDRLELRRLTVAGAAGRSRFESIASTSPDGIICADETGTLTFWNAAAERLFGFSAREAIGSSIDLLVPERLRGGPGHELLQLASSGLPDLAGRTIDFNAARADGSELAVELSLSTWREDGSVKFGAIIRNLTDRRANEKRLFALAHLDALTGLANRSVLSRRIVESIASGEPAAVLMVDLDGFKDVNDTLGHSAGDAVLKEVGRRILECCRRTDTVCRLGGDEFAILMPQVSQRTAIADVADCVLARLAEPVSIENHTVFISASVGIASFPEDGTHVEKLLSAADLALYQAKNEGRNCRRFFSAPLREAALRRRAFEGEIRLGLTRHEFRLCYQPQVRVADGATIGFEALLRWHHPELGLVGPDRFLPSVDLSPQAADMGRWVLEQACQDAVVLRGVDPRLRIGVNLFGSQFRTGRLAEDVQDALTRHGLPPEALELEITENIILRHDETVLAPLHRLREMGVGVAFDDFGTGFASLSFLKRFPLSRIKIDRSFVADICDDPRDAAIVNATVYIASALDLEVVAEGVETEQQSAFLRGCGCGVMQGFLYGRPMTLGHVLHDLAERDRAVA